MALRTSADRGTPLQPHHHTTSSHHIIRFHDILVLREGGPRKPPILDEALRRKLGTMAWQKFQSSSARIGKGLNLCSTARNHHILQRSIPPLPLYPHDISINFSLQAVLSPPRCHSVRYICTSHSISSPTIPHSSFPVRSLHRALCRLATLIL
jgi:hypothetical protein